MSRQRSDYPGSRWDKFSRWLHGDYDPFAGKLEMKRPEEFPSPPPLDWKQVDLSAAQHVGDDLDQGKQFRLFRKLYKAASCVLCLSIIVILLITVANLPPFGDPANPANNEVSERYIEKGLQETGAVNIVTGMILDYRAFDTFGESTVLFCAACCVLILLRLDDSKKAKAEEFDQIYEPREDTILEQAARILFPMIMMFGVYIVLNGHLSPGGGFSGGAIMGAGLILYLNAFGFQKTQRFFTEKTFRYVSLGALMFYCCAKSYSFFTGANHLPSGIPLGTPGAILSSGLIFYLNICVGLVVACTMYAFFVMLRKGGF